MRIVLSCPHCELEGINREEVTQLSRVRDDHIYSMNCPNGHNLVHIIINYKFEMLYDFGLMALMDGYAREAVSSFAAAFERFIEFSIEIILKDSGIENDSFKETWKSIKKSSERQIGSFYFLFLHKYRAVPPWKIIESERAFRNSVIHEGYIPTEEETITYAKSVYNQIELINNTLKESSNEEYRKFLSDRQEMLTVKSEETKLKCYLLIDTTLGASRAAFFGRENTRVENFEQSYARAKERFQDGWNYQKDN